MKKTIATLAAAILIIGLMPVTALAHGHSGGRTTKTTYSYCSVENCNTSGNHKHNNTTYSGHYIDDGHDYHQICSVQGCNKTTNHEHDGTVCFPHSSGDGHSYHNSGSGGSNHH